MLDRNTAIVNFLQANDWGDAARMPLAGDASARQYERLLHPSNGARAVLMDAPPEGGIGTAPFLEIADFLKSFGFSSPEIIAFDEEIGLILMEDLGDDLFTRVCAQSPDLEVPIYEAAIDVLCALHRISPPDILPYSQGIYLREARLLTDWYLPAVTGVDAPQDLTAEFEALVSAACKRLNTAKDVCVLRDYHAENLIWLPDRQGIARVGQLDFQDALIGHPAYDLVSLLEDARRDTSHDLREAMLARYLEQSGLDPVEFRQGYAILGAQRNLKIVGIFARLWLRDGKQSYIDLIPRVWDHLQRDLQHPALSALRGFVESHVPEPTFDCLAQLKAARA